MFHNRSDAGRRLATRLCDVMGEETGNVIVLGLPRGGVVVAAETARALNAPLDVLIACKIGSPDRPELAIGAIASGGGGVPRTVMNDELVRICGVDESYISREIARQLEVIRERESSYRSGRPAIEVEGRTVIVVDDGIATGATVRASLSALRDRRPKKLVLAVPVAPAETIERLKDAADEVICLHAPPDFRAVGQYYADFSQTTDRQVNEVLEQCVNAPSSRTT